MTRVPLDLRASTTVGASGAPSAAPAAATAPTAGTVDRLARRAVLARLRRMDIDAIAFRDPGGDEAVVGTPGPAGGTPLPIEIRAPRFWRRLVTGGALGFADAWCHGEWHTDDLAALLRTFVRGDAAGQTERADTGMARVGRLAARLGHRLAANTRTGSRRNIHAHYDLGNELFGLFLDETMTYSAAWFQSPEQDLASAQTAKLDRLCRELGLQPGMKVLEIGTGWGSFALHAAGRYGCHVTTTTISREQHELARRRIAAAGLEDRVTLRLEDYRDLKGRYDAVASIEMIEAVGHAFLPTYFGVIADRLAPGGRACIQAISMPDHRYEAYRHRADFIQRVIFPGSCCPSIAAMTDAMGRGSDLRVTGLHDLGLDYAETLRQWRDRFDARIADVRALGYDERFIRTWQYYLAYCEAGFAERYISVAQLTLARTGGPAGGAMHARAEGPHPDAARVQADG